jgi:hypothetical protein
MVPGLHYEIANGMVMISSSRLLAAVLIVSVICVVTNQIRLTGYMSPVTQNMIAYATFLLSLAASITGFLYTPHRARWAGNAIASVLTLLLLSEPTVFTALWTLFRVMASI